MHHASAHGCPRRWLGAEHRTVGRVHGVEVARVAQVHAVGDQVAVAHSRCLEHASDVGKRALRLRRDVPGHDRPAGGIVRYCAGHEQGIASENPVCVSRTGGLPTVRHDPLQLHPLAHCHHRHLNEAGRRRQIRAYRGAGRRVGRENLAEDLIHAIVVAIVGEEHVQADHARQVRARGLEHTLEVGERLSGLCLDPVRVALTRDPPQRAGGVEEVAGPDRVTEGQIGASAGKHDGTLIGRLRGDRDKGRGHGEDQNCGHGAGSLHGSLIMDRGEVRFRCIGSILHGNPGAKTIAGTHRSPRSACRAPR